MAEMKQYCRYCNELTYGDVPYCSKRNKVLSEAYAKSRNRCKFFEFNPMDAFGENLNGYKPRERNYITNDEYEQLRIDMEWE